MKNCRRRGSLYLSLLVALLPLSLACSSGQTGSSVEGITLRIVHQAAGAPLEIDQLIYTNAAGNPYSVTKFEYLISDVELSNGAPDSEIVLTETLYGDAVNQGNSSHAFEGLAAGDFDTLSFVWGVPAARNSTGSLPVEYDGMLWPPQFGGGYHAMRFEGDWSDVSPGDDSYALHAGHLRRCSNLAIAYADCPVVDRIDETGMVEISLPISTITTGAGRRWTVEIVIDVDDWMNDPVYDLGQAWSDPSLCPASITPPCTLSFPTMPGPEPQSMMRLNGADVFSVTVSEN